MNKRSSSSPTQLRTLLLGSYTSQFENHIRCFEPLGNTDSKVAGIMVNLVGRRVSGNGL
jgi:phosphoribosylaminoimidazole carboxylase (NCAIR synthetase)